MYIPRASLFINQMYANLSPTRFVSEEEREAKYNRVLSSSIMAFGKLISVTSDKARAEMEELYLIILRQNKFWKLARHKSPNVSIRERVDIKEKRKRNASCDALCEMILAVCQPLYPPSLFNPPTFTPCCYCDDCIPGPETETLAQIRQIHIKQPCCLLQNNDNLPAREW